MTQDGQQITQVADSDLFQSDDKGPANAFTLQPGDYTLQFELNIDGQADTRSEIQVSATTDLVVP